MAKQKNSTLRKESLTKLKNSEKLFQDFANLYEVKDDFTIVTKYIKTN